MALLPLALAAQILPSTFGAGTNSTTLLLPDGTIRAWGSNRFGALGTGTTGDSPRPVPAGTGTTYAQLAEEDYHTLALRTEGTLLAGGCNLDGALGNGTTTDRTTPTREITLNVGWLTTAAGQSFTLARTSASYAIVSTSYNASG